ncbi:phage tail sheath subtilisin-like domain-containing protein [bacterium]|nr:phage tail sheath subtilisin-like domain-containing protein [bacterium]
MAFQVSPGVLVQEKDLTRIIPAVSTSIGAFAGEFRKGPINEITTISSEQELVSVFGKPDASNYEDFFSAANFLQYSNALRVVRTQNSSVSNATESGSTFVIKSLSDYVDNYADGSGSIGLWAAKTAGAWGNNLKISTCPSSTVYSSSGITVNDSSTAAGDTVVTVSSGTSINVGDIINFGDNYNYKVLSKSTNDITIKRKDEPEHFTASDSSGLFAALTDGATVTRYWEFYDLVSKAPGTSPYVTQAGGSNDELHIVVVDEDGGITGTKGEVLEVFAALSKASDAKGAQGDTNYYPTVIQNKSNYIYWMDHNSSGTNWGSAAASTTYTDVTAVSNVSLSNGANGSTRTNAQLLTSYELFKDAETVDVGLIIAGKGDATHIDNLISIAEDRKDAVVFASPERSDVVNVSSAAAQATNVIAFFNGIRSSSYVMFDSGYKYMYDRYSDVYRYVPLNGDLAGLSARTDLIADAWYSPAGLNRGIIRGAVKLAFNPTKTQRDDLYRARVNPVATFPGQGTVLFGDKTGLTAPSAFDRINVRRLFITLEKAVATASKFQLFEFNDEFTRANFRNIVEPFLREVQGRRGITDFLVVCDETNNTGEVIDRNEFIAEIFIKPARSINFITLQFIATRTGVSFDEVAGG